MLPKRRARNFMWFVYIVTCVDGTLYTGITNDVLRRIHEHNNNLKGATYTSRRRPVTLVYQEAAATRSAALVREHAIKKLTRIQKKQLIIDHGS